MMRKIGYIALSLYLLLVSLLSFIPNLIVPSSLMTGLALIASFGIFLDTCIPPRKYERKENITSAQRNLNTPYQ
jgi:hypothetical protein